MSRLMTIDSDTASETTRDALEKVRVSLGMIPNLYRTMANSPRVLEGYLNFRGALIKGVLPRTLWEQIALVVAQNNDCQYCVSAHTLRGKKIGLSEEELKVNRHAESSDPITAAALRFAGLIVQQRGHVSDEDLMEVRKAGYEDTEIAEIVGHVALNMFSNYFSHIAQPELDFPPVLMHEMA